jgi:hypothetical protein
MMSNNLDTFIKYADGDLSNIDRKVFEEQLVHDSKLKADFELFSQLYASSKNKIRADDRYFTTLLPNAKKRIIESKSFWKYKYRLVFPILIVGLIILFAWPSPTSDYENFNNFIEIASLDDELVNDIISANPNYFINEEVIPEFYDEDIIIDASVFDYLEENLSSVEINNDLVDSFSESEFLSIYEQILDKNIVGIK